MSQQPKKKPIAAADVLQRLFENGKSPLSDGFLRWKLENKWPEVVGKTIAKNSRPVFYDKGILIVEVNNSAWMNEIRFFNREIITKVNSHIGYSWVKTLRYIHK